MIFNVGTMGKVIVCDVCGDKLTVEAWYEIKQAIIDNGWVKVGTTKKHKTYCPKCGGGK